MIAFLVWLLAFSPFLVRQHGLTDMDPPIINDIDRMNLISLGLQDFYQGISQGHVAQMAQMQGLVGIRTTKFYDYIFFHFAGAILFLFFAHSLKYLLC